jgi:hypothetical protein
MPRKLRIEYPGAMYHIMSRGDRRKKIFLDDVDRQDFLKTLAEQLQRQGWQEADLLARRKSDAVKLEIAARLRRETTLSTKAIAARVHLGSSKAANRSLHRYMHGGAAARAGQGQLGI